MRSVHVVCLSFLLALAVAASAQSFRVQCPTFTITHPLTGTSCSTNPKNAGCNNTEPAYNGPTQFSTLGVTASPSGIAQGGYVMPVKGTANGAIKCQQISGGDGYSTMGDGTQTFMFSFGPLSGLADIAAGHPGTQPPYIFNVPYTAATGLTLTRGDPATTDGAASGAMPWTGAPGAFSPGFSWNGAVGLMPDVANTVTVSNLVEGPITSALYPGATVPGCATTTAPGNLVTAWTDAPLGLAVGAQVAISNAVAEGPTPTPPGYAGTFTISCVATGAANTPDGFEEYAFQYFEPSNVTGLAADTGNDLAAIASTPAVIDGHVDPRPIMDVGVMNGNIPGPLAAFDEDDEFFLTLTNVGMIMRPDLFEQHTVHFHGYPNASSFYDGVPDASVAINIGASFTYYYLAPDAGTYFYHCHITPPEHLQMGMVSQLYVRPRQNRVPVGGSLFTALEYQNGTVEPTGRVVDKRTACNTAQDILCSATNPAVHTTIAQTTDPLVKDPANGSFDLTDTYVYNDGDGSTQYDAEYPLQMHGFDPNFHFVGMTFNPEMFVDMKDKYFLLNGRGYPDTTAPGPQATITSDGQMHYSQPMPAIINIPAGGKALLRLVNLSVTEYHTLQSLGVPMHVVGWNAKLLRDQAGVNTEYWTNSITLGGGESLDAILDTSVGKPDGTAYKAGEIYYLYTPQLDHLSNDAENFGGMMTEVHICNTVTGTTYGNTCN